MTIKPARLRRAGLRGPVAKKEFLSLKIEIE
jgi:hypothetical protein